MQRPALTWILGLLLTTTAPAGWATPFAGVVFADDPGLAPHILLPGYRDAMGKPVSEDLIAGVRVGLIARYRSLGYLPPSPRVTRVHDAAGVVQIEIREARVGRVTVDGREHVDTPEFWLLVRELEQLRPLSRRAFDAWLQKANTLGPAIHGTLMRAGGDSHQYLARLSVRDQRWQAVAHLDNRGPDELGREIAQVSFSYRSPRQLLGSLRVDVAAALDHERLRYAGISGQHRLLRGGDTLSWRYSRSESALPIVDSDRIVDYERQRAELEWRHPLVRRTRHRADVGLGLRLYDLDQFLDDGRRLRRDRIRSLRLRYDLATAAGEGRRHRLNLTLDQGLNHLGALLEPAEADIGYLVADAEYRYEQRLNAAWQIGTDVHLQLSGDVLPSSERFFVGGSQLGGAFDPATLSGDQGLGARVGIERLMGAARFRTPVTAFAYYDHGYVWSNDPRRPSDDAGSAGLGLRGAYRQLSWRVEVAFPAVAPATPTLINDRTRLYFALTQRF